MEVSRWACIQNEIVVNIIVSDSEFVSHIVGYDAIIDLTGIIPEPQIGWSYIEGIFIDPSV